MTASVSTTALRQQFEQLVKQAEAEVAADPKAYKRRLALLAALGYGVIFGLLALLIAILGGTVALALTSTAFLILLFKKKLFILILVPIWVLFRSLFVRISPPDGYPLPRRQFPVLWGEIDRLRAELDALPIHQVILTPDMNAGVTQTPRLGVFGPHKNTLILGLELLLSLSPEQARAVLAHEFGHLSNQHGRFGAWIYRKRLTWARIQAAFDVQSGLGFGPIRRFMSWYVPRLAGYSFALARQQEYEADAVASRLTSPREMASALVLCGTREALTRDSFWRPLLRRATTSAEPEEHTYSLLREHLRSAPLDGTLAEEKIAAAMRVRTGFADTHPSLRDRLSAIGELPTVTIGHDSAADAWLDTGLAKVLADFDADWLDNNRQAWANRHQLAQTALDKLRELSAKSADELTQMEIWQVAALTEEFMPEVDPLAAYKAYRARYPEDPDADFVIGRMLVSRHNDEAGVPCLERAAQSPALKEAACGMIAAFYAQNGRSELSEQWLREAEAAYDVNAEARAERDEITAADSFQPARLDPALEAAVARAIRASAVGPRIKRIWVAEKVVRQMPESPVVLVLVQPRLFSRNKAELGSQLARDLPQVIDLPHTWFFISDVAASRAIARKVKTAGREIGAADAG